MQTLLTLLIVAAAALYLLWPLLARWRPQRRPSAAPARAAASDAAGGCAGCPAAARCPQRG